VRQTDILIRRTVPDDLEAISTIYAHHVQTSVATFELTPPDPPEWQRRLQAITGDGLPFLTATRDGRVAGYAYCSPWKVRPACAGAGVREVIAVIVDADGAASLALHRNRGFVDAGRLTAVGFKHGRWLDTLLLQRSLPPLTRFTRTGR
jgi:L-amino acid N-acyltransferase YncA